MQHLNSRRRCHLAVDMRLLPKRPRSGDIRNIYNNHESIQQCRDRRWHNSRPSTSTFKGENNRSAGYITYSKAFSCDSFFFSLLLLFTNLNLVNWEWTNRQVEVVLPWRVYGMCWGRPFSKCIVSQKDIRRRTANTNVSTRAWLRFIVASPGASSATGSQACE